MTAQEAREVADAHCTNKSRERYVEFKNEVLKQITTTAQQGGYRYERLVILSEISRATELKDELNQMGYETEMSQWYDGQYYLEVRW